eukprot:scaffold22435_cov120-Isochrysis_galbana.AAC.1
MACQSWCRASNQQGSHPCKNSHPQPRLDFGPSSKLVHDRPRVSESALSEGTAPVWPWRGAWCLASVGSGASGSRASVSSVG